MLNPDRRLVLAAPLALLAACKGSATGDVAASGVSLVDPAEMTMGDRNAKVVMLEYASAACSHCAEFNNTVFGAFKTKYIDTGKVYYRHREMLTAEPSLAASGFLLARCAGRERYFGVLDAIYHRQAEAFTPGVDLRGLLLEIGRSAGLTEAQFDVCINNAEALEVLSKRNQDYLDGGVTGTPYILINDKKVDDMSMAGLEAAYKAAGGV